MLFVSLCIRVTHVVYYTHNNNNNGNNTYTDANFTAIRSRNPNTGISLLCCHCRHLENYTRKYTHTQISGMRVYVYKTRGCIETCSIYMRANGRQRGPPNPSRVQIAENYTFRGRLICIIVYKGARATTTAIHNNCCSQCTRKENRTNLRSFHTPSSNSTGVLIHV